MIKEIIQIFKNKRNANAAIIQMEIRLDTSCAQ